MGSRGDTEKGGGKNGNRLSKNSIPEGAPRGRYRITGPPPRRTGKEKKSLFWRVEEAGELSLPLDDWREAL